MRSKLVPSLVVTLAIVATVAAADSEWRHQTLRHGLGTVSYTAPDSATAAAVAGAVERGADRVRRFFGGRFPRPIAVRVHPSRAALDSTWQVAWHAPGFHSECWMVASGAGNALDVLSPRVWKTEACEHDARDLAHVDRLIAHELTHVYQGQHGPRPDLDGMDDLGWFVEGVAVLASGQLEDRSMARAEDAIASGADPHALAQAWSGKYRYGVSGSLVRFVDRRVGRRVLVRMLADTTQAQLLGHVGMSESQLLAEWRGAVGAPKR